MTAPSPFFFVYHTSKMATIRYTPQLSDLLFITTASRFFELLGSRGQLATLLILKNVDSVIPALPLLEREKVYDKLIENPVIPYICSFNIRDVELNLPILPDGKKYDSLKEITVDELNVVSIIQMIEQNLFPNLRSLTIFTSSPTKFETANLGQLRFLTLQNMSDTILPLPDLKDLPVEELFLAGYVMEFKRSLPRKLTLEQCLVIRSERLSGCEEMTLFNVRWGDRNQMSFPTKSLHIERGKLSTQPPASLKRLSLVDSKVSTSDVSLHLLPVLEVARFDNIDTSDPDGPAFEREAHVNGVLDIVSPNGALVELTIAAGDTFRCVPPIPNSVKILHIGKEMSRFIPLSVFTVELDSIEMSLRELLSLLPENIEVLKIVKCTFSVQEDVMANEFPQNLTRLWFAKCESKVKVSVSPPPKLNELLIVGRTPSLNGEGTIYPYEKSPCLKWLRSVTNTLLMDLREFELYCLDKLNKNIFAEYEDCFLDATRGAAWHNNPDLDMVAILRGYIEILLKYPFHIPQPQDSSVARDVIIGGNAGITIKIGNNSHSVEYLQALLNSPIVEEEGSPKGDTKLRTFIESVREAMIAPHE